MSNVAVAWDRIRRFAMAYPKEVSLAEIYAIDNALLNPSARSEIAPPKERLARITIRNPNLSRMVKIEINGETCELEAGEKTDLCLADKPSVEPTHDPHWRSPVRDEPKALCVVVPKLAWDGFVSMLNARLGKPTNRDKSPADLQRDSLHGRRNPARRRSFGS